MTAMRRTIGALVLATTLLPAAAQAGSWSWSTPWSSGSGSVDSSTFASTGSLTVSTTSPVSWSFSLSPSANTISGSATVDNQTYSGSLDWSNLFSWLFG